MLHARITEPSARGALVRCHPLPVLLKRRPRFLSYMVSTWSSALRVRLVAASCWLNTAGKGAEAVVRWVEELGGG